MSKLLSLDLSTTCSGISIFSIKEKSLLDFFTIKPPSPSKISKGFKDLKYPEKQLVKMLEISKELLKVVQKVNPDIIIIEEIAGSKQRLGQKVLDGLHWIFLNKLLENKVDFSKIVYYDVTGKDGWRTHLGLKLSDADKLQNKEAKTLNKKLSTKNTKLSKITPKTLACKFANKKFGLQLNEVERSEDADLADSICMGYSYLKNVREGK